MTEQNPAAVVQAHIDFLEASADTIITHTCAYLVFGPALYLVIVFPSYQLPSEQFARANTDPNFVPDICRSAMRIAVDARRQYPSRADKVPVGPKMRYR